MLFRGFPAHTHSHFDTHLHASTNLALTYSNSNANTHTHSLTLSHIHAPAHKCLKDREGLFWHLGGFFCVSIRVIVYSLLPPFTSFLISLPGTIFGNFFVTWWSTQNVKKQFWKTFFLSLRISVWNLMALIAIEIALAVVYWKIKRTSFLSEPGFGGWQLDTKNLIFCSNWKKWRNMTIFFGKILWIRYEKRRGSISHSCSLPGGPGLNYQYYHDQLQS